jgi:nucleoside-diphosphate-sugar epimerase
LRGLRRILLTGGTGSLGGELAKALLEQDPDREIWAIVRRKATRFAPGRDPLVEPHDLSRFHVIEGDIELPGLGFGTDGYPEPELPDRIDACFHLAACTEFTERRRAQIFRANLDGTRHVVAFLEGIPAFGKLYHVSTAYVSGIGAGMVREKIHARPLRFANPYEESKHAAESVVADSGLDWTILRPSILMGHSGTGEAHDSKTIYGVFKTYWRLREMLRNKYSDAEIADLSSDPFVVVCRPDVAKNVLCLDDGVRLMLEVADRRPPAGTIYHLSNPRPTDNSTLTGAMLSLLGLQCLTLQPEPPARLRVEEQLIDRGTRLYRPYMVCDEAEFDQAQLRQLIGDPAVDSVLPMTPPRLHFLFDCYLRRHLEARVETSHDSGVDRRALVRKHGRGVLAYSSTVGDGVSLPISRDEGFVACAVKGRTAAMIGDPVCAPEHFGSAVEAFFGYCTSHSYRPAAVQVSRPVADALARHEGHCNRMGDEAVIDLPLFEASLPGGRWQKLRRFRNTARAGGITVRECSYGDVSSATADEVSRAWLATKLNERELAFLTRPLPLQDEPDVRKFFAFRGEELVGLVVFDPLYEAGRLIGYYADVERYKRSPNGIHGLILLEAIRVFREEGHQVLSLGLAPLFHLEEEDHPSASASTRDLFRRIRDEVAPVYNFRGASQHKTCYNPRWEPTYFYAQFRDSTSEVLDVLSLIGLLAPEAVYQMHRETFERVQGA